MIQRRSQKSKVIQNPAAPRFYGGVATAGTQSKSSATNPKISLSERYCLPTFPTFRTLAKGVLYPNENCDKWLMTPEKTQALQEHVQARSPEARSLRDR